MRWPGFVATAIAPLLLMGAAPAPAGEAWTPAWTASMWQGTNDSQRVLVDNATISFTVRVGAAGDKLRLRLSNEYGQALRIGAASVRLPNGKSVPVLFGGQKAITMGAGTILSSDAAALPVKAFDLVQVSIYIPDTVSLSAVHAAPGAKTAISLSGDQTGASFDPARTSPQRPLLAGIDVSGPARPVIVAFGDSITDNAGCPNEEVPICRWGDVLGRRLAKAKAPYSVVTQAISGNRILNMGTGPSALDRFDRDVLALPNVKYVVILEGVNDIGGSGRKRPDGTAAPAITAQQLIDGYRQLIDRAHKKGIKVMGLTILPFKGAGYHTDEGEAMRKTVNNWILTSGAFDASYDLAKLMGDPADPDQLDLALQRGDHLHPNGAGETKMGEAIPLKWFR